MTYFLQEHYHWLKALHVISVIFWMAGMAYLPRLFVYHAEAEAGSDKSETFKIMERRLLRGIINPAMIATIFFGGLIVMANTSVLEEGWFHAKLGLVVVMTALHGLFARWRKDFAADRNKHPARFYRIVNEAPPVLVVLIVILVIVQPF
ncbi:MAG: protoporphyrinogen oxidase HemJ [Parvibaculum sp.]|jgi:putative membrane protein|uniref:protoporphyrinogen oxidase HemJ n=1 Tax=Parvibaculum sp. TaxID=2024848 RepID=UPI00284DA1FA|nr:protoporphyrinogen oxidase HemJ [Parvibaculum sp.]MDR3500644.1 protoporphyrinogen oxidase HemJ [Parvibaculum sp.]